MRENMVNFNQVSKRYPGQWALQEVSFTLPKGYIIGLVGPNGSGKSTILKLIAGLIRPTSGEVLIEGQKAHRRLSEKIAYLTELDAYYPFFTVADAIQFHNSLYPDFDMEKAKDMMAFMELDPTKKIKELSKGNRGRLKMVLTLAREAPLVLLDEPLSGLDPMVRDSIIRGLISYLDLPRQTLILTTHHIAEIEPLLDLVVALKEGKILAMEEVEEIRSSHHQNLVEWMKRVYN